MAVYLKEQDFETVESFHAFIAQALDFPDYYGENLDALADCLGDICHPVEVSICRKFDNVDNWFDQVSSIFIQAALENPNIRLTMEG